MELVREASEWLVVSEDEDIWISPQMPNAKHRFTKLHNPSMFLEEFPCASLAREKGTMGGALHVCQDT